MAGLFDIYSVFTDGLTKETGTGSGVYILKRDNCLTGYQIIVVYIRVKHGTARDTAVRKEVTTYDGRY